ncbi:Starch-binding associating with outer membrane [Parapedobacter composti]|uniref:Starch-binding associating with outer membrane n=1 Tax=Parapedobacter composti TaxID=623281 RepID=A0A1I1LHP1_9SPHI|nr:RagB/SusD family nutrient uptake outer membrane protein [Parapedobacter composti]SFC72485.1 Starch-binding associating with outer membrane [Parapedobacter composti]
MKRTLKTIIIIWSLLFAGCNKFLDREPLAEVTPEQYLSNEANLASYAIGLYDMLPTHDQWGYGTFTFDNHTDNMAGMYPSPMYAPGQSRVEQTGGDWDFALLYRCNYFLQQVVPKVARNEIAGNPGAINHYLGEVYFMRAFAYFQKLQALGDFPIITEILPDEHGALTEASKRRPRNEVARFILEDLDRAIDLLNDVPPNGGKNRLNKLAAYLFKSRVALFEGTWLKYFRGTAFVPGGTGWPGAVKDYNSAYQFPSGSIDGEIDFFLSEAMVAASVVADAVPLVENTGTYQHHPTDPVNPYFNMFSDENMEGYSEVLLWRKYSVGMVTNSVGSDASRANSGVGTTRSMINAFIMQDGKPIYASPAKMDENTSYWGDEELTHITKNRDTRAQLFVKKPGDRNLHTPPGSHGYEYEPCPNLIATTGDEKYTTGYAIRKGLNFNGKHTQFLESTIGSIVFRASEAYLNYIEACYEKNGSLDGIADNYWKKIRQRAKINEDYLYTTGLTNMAEEGKTDWGAYSSGQLVDPLLFNIRRERRCELMAEGLRMMDIKRWRSMDQLIHDPYHVEGIDLYSVLYPEWDCYRDANGISILAPGVNVSHPSFGKYLQPYRISPNNIAYNGYRWHMAHYLAPIAIQHFINTSDGNLQESPIYQNPGWPLEAGGTPQ